MTHAPTILAFDTSVIGSSVAVSVAGKLFSTTDISAGTQATRLIPMIESVLNEAGIWYQDVDRLMTTIGPGSFTGIRIGLAAAQGVIAAHPMEIAALTSLEAMAWQAHHTGLRGEIWVVFNAGKGETVAKMFHVKQSGVEPASDELLLEPSELAAYIGKNQPIIGNAATLLAETLHAQCVDSLTLPNAAQFIAAAIPLSSEAALVPYYVRPPDAKLPNAP